MSEIPDDLQSLKVAELKELSGTFNLPKSGNKKDLILRLQELKALSELRNACKAHKEALNASSEFPPPPQLETVPEVSEESNAEEFTNEETFLEPALEPEPPVSQKPQNIESVVENESVATEQPTGTTEDSIVEENGLTDEVREDSKCEDEIVLNVPDETEEEALDWEVEDESCLNDTTLSVTPKIADDVANVDVKSATDDASVMKEVTVDADADNREEGELPTPTEMDEGEIQDVEDDVVKKSSSTESVEPEEVDAKRRKEDKSREVEGTQQMTVVVAAKGDRPSFDIKIVTPVKTQSKPVKIRKRHEAGESAGELPVESSGEHATKMKKRKWLTTSAPSDAPQNIIISTDVLKDIVSPHRTSPDKDRSSLRSVENSEKQSKDHDKKEKVVKEKQESTEENPEKKVVTESVGDGPTEEEKRIGKKVKTNKSGGGKEEDLEEGEHKSKHAQISFSDVESGKALKPVKVKGRLDADSSSAPQQVELPKRENPDVPVPNANNPVSTIVHVMRLTRPFTLPQLKALLGKFGEVVEEEFWIDDIKSQCYVKYTQESSAKECREALYGCKWPSTNHRTLKLEFVSQIQLDDVRGMLQKIIRKTSGSPPAVRPKIARSSPAENMEKHSSKYSSGSAMTKVQRERRRSRSVSRESEDFLAHKIAKAESRKQRDRDLRAEPLGKSSARKELEMRDKYHERREQKRKEEEERLKNQEDQAPVKLLDDLFRKTKAEPWVYWLPLTDEQTVGRDKKRAQELRELQEESIKLKNTIANTSHGNRDRGDLSPNEDRGRYSSSNKRAAQRSNYNSPPSQGLSRHSKRSPPSPGSPPSHNRSDRHYHSGGGGGGDRRGAINPHSSSNSSKVRGHMKHSDRHNGRYR